MTIDSGLLLRSYLLGLVLASFELILALAMAMLASLSALGLTDRLTQKTDEWKEIARGNLAIGLLFFSILVSVAWVDEPVVAAVLYALHPGLSVVQLAVVFILGFLNLILATLLATGVIYLAVTLFDRMTVGIDELNELKKGNVAVGLVLSGAIFAIVFISQRAILQLIDAIGLARLVPG